MYISLSINLFKGDVLLPHASTILENSAQDWAITLVPDQARDCEDGETVAYLLELCPVCDAPQPGYSEISFKFNSQFASAFHYKRYPVDFQEVECVVLASPAAFYCLGKY